MHKRLLTKYCRHFPEFGTVCSECKEEREKKSSKYLNIIPSRRPKKIFRCIDGSKGIKNVSHAGNDMMEKFWDLEKSEPCNGNEDVPIRESRFHIKLMEDEPGFIADSHSAWKESLPVFKDVAANIGC